MLDVLHVVVLRAMQLLLLPVLIGCWIEQACFGAERWFGFWAECFSLVPGFPGSLVRKAYYAATLRGCAARAYIAFGAVIGHRDASIGRMVSIGRYALIGSAAIGDGAQLASRVSITSGRRQHDLVAEPNAATRLEHVSIGADAWIGEGAIVMADVGRGSVVGAGSVVTRPVADGTVVAGNPARELGAARALHGIDGRRASAL